MRLAKTTAVIACLAAVVLGGCGSSDNQGKPIPATTQQELDKQLDSIEARFQFGGGACSDIAENKQSVEKTIDALPDDTDADVKSALQDGFDHLFQLTDEQCDEKKGQNTDTTTHSEPAPTPTTSAPDTTPTTPSETTPAQTTPSEQKPKKPKDQKGNGGGHGGGNGGGNGGSAAPQSGTGGGGAAAPGELP